MKSKGGIVDKIQLCDCISHYTHTHTHTHTKKKKTAKKMKYLISVCEVMPWSEVAKAA